MGPRKRKRQEEEDDEEREAGQPGRRRKLTETTFTEVDELVNEYAEGEGEGGGEEEEEVKEGEGEQEEDEAGEEEQKEDIKVKLLGKRPAWLSKEKWLALLQQQKNKLRIKMRKDQHREEDAKRKHPKRRNHVYKRPLYSVHAGDVSLTVAFDAAQKPTAYVITCSGSAARLLLQKTGKGRFKEIGRYTGSTAGHKKYLAAIKLHDGATVSPGERSETRLCAFFSAPAKAAGGHFTAMKQAADHAVATYQSQLLPKCGQIFLKEKPHAQLMTEERIPDHHAMNASENPIQLSQLLDKNGQVSFVPSWFTEIRKGSVQDYIQAVDGNRLPLLIVPSDMPRYVSSDVLYAYGRPTTVDSS
jgi:hypothetical protein